MKYPHSWRSCLRCLRSPITPIALCLAASNAYGGLVANWLSDDYTTGANWTSTAATGSIVANVQGSPVAIDGTTDPSFNGHDLVDLPGGSYFVVPAANNPLAGAQQLTLVAVFKPFGTGSPTDGFWWQAMGLIGMEQGGSVADWGFGWMGNRITGGVGGPDITTFSLAQPTQQVIIAMFTWSGGVQKVYRNGVLADSDVNVATAPRNAADFALGAMTSGGGTPFNGQIAELQMYNTDESANATTIFNTLKNKYVGGVMLDYAKLNSLGGTIVLNDTTGATTNLTGGTEADFDVFLDGSPTALPDGDVTVTKSGSLTTIKFTAPLAVDIAYPYSISVPLVTGGPQTIEGNFLPFSMPASSTMAGPTGAVGSWGIRQFTAAPTNGNLDGAVAVATPASAAFVEDASAPVFNHADPDTNGGVASQGNFNNDLNVISNTAADDNWVVLGRTKITVAAETTRTFSIHSDDGFALRIVGPAGGGFTATGGTGRVDPGDDETIIRDGGTGDSDTRGIYHFAGAGTYDVFYLGWDGGGGGYYEVAWAEGAFKEDRHGNTWALLGTPTDPEVPALRERWVTNLPGPAGTDGAFGVRTYKSVASANGNLTPASDFLSTTTRSPSDPDGLTIDTQLPYLNHRDPNNGGGGGLIPGDQPFPGDTGADDNNVVTTAKARITIAATGSYTFAYAGDDSFMLRVKGVNGNPDPSWRIASNQSTFQMSNPNEWFYEPNGELNGRGVIDLAAGQYDLEFITTEGGGGFYYELVAAAGVWINTNPPGGFRLVGYVAPSPSVLVPGITNDGWSVLTGNPNDNTWGATINGAEARITNTAGAPTIWDVLNFDDPQNGGGGNFTPNNPFPKNTPIDDNDYAMKATGILDITQAGDYNLGFQGDDGGYMYIYGHNGTTDPEISSIFFTNLPGIATIGVAPGSSVNNAIRAETGTGNSRTLVTVPLAVGQYRIVTLVYEGGGGSWWEVIGAKADFDATFVVPLLARNGATTIPVTNGLPVVAQPIIVDDSNFKLTSVSVTGNPVSTVSFNIGTQDGATYEIQGSINLVDWITLDASVPATGSSTPYTVNLSEHPTLNGQTKVFFRAVRNP